jgi:hydroxymethylglutaryl-CoA synthase
VSGIIAYGAYLPYNRLKREAIGAALGVPAGSGTRTVASYDEDATTMGAEAAREALRTLPDGVEVASLVLATTSPAYLDKTNATAIHAALGLDPAVSAADAVGAVRSGVAGLRSALHSDETSLVILSDVRTGLPGSVDERDGGDGAVALVVGPDAHPESRSIATFLGGASATTEVLERWRVPGEDASRVWEERFGEHAYVPLADQAFTDALKKTGVVAGEIDHLVLTGTHARTLRSVARATGVRPEAFVDDLSKTVGNTGAAHPGLLLAGALERAKPGETIALLVVADGAEVLLFRATDAIASYQAASTVASLVAGGNDAIDYQKFLTWRGLLRREPPRRPDPLSPEAPPSFRYEAWKYAFNGSKCDDCGTVHLPPQEVCASCKAVRRMSPLRMADVPATIATYTIDRLAFSLNPPSVFAVIDFEGGGRFRCEMTDVDPDAVAIGDKVEMTFRRIFQASNGVVNYFWKAKPSKASETASETGGN